MLSSTQPPTAHTSKSLNYLQPSPVRGQLEPYDPTTPVGWRYVQTTDTLNELKVLIPPGTAAMYEQLLKFEKYELTKKSINWPLVIEIRHLKDRMIRKCQKMARAAITPPESLSPFQTFIAPEDFRVKDMERWFREQQKRASAAAVRRAVPSTDQPPDATIHSNHHSIHPQCPQCIIASESSTRALVPQTKPLTNQLQTSKHNLQRSATNTIPPSKSSFKTFKPGLYSRAQALVNISRAIKPERSTSLPTKQSQTLRAPARPSVVSPPPLPVILRGQRSQFGLEDETNQVESLPGDPERGESLVSESPPSPVPKDLVAEENQLNQTSPRSSSDETSPNPDGVVRRKRSCIKRASVNEFGAKTVSWADDQEIDNQMSRYASVARDAQKSGRQWEEIKEIYLEQISGLENLQLQVQEGLESLKMESEHLQRVDDTIRRQREQLRDALDVFEHKQTIFNDKVKEAIEQADDVMSRHGLQKPPLSITNGTE